MGGVGVTFTFPAQPRFIQLGHKSNNATLTLNKYYQPCRDSNPAKQSERNAGACNQCTLAVRNNVHGTRLPEHVPSCISFASKQRDNEERANNDYLYPILTAAYRLY